MTALPCGARVVLRMNVRVAGGLAEPAGAPGVVQRDNGRVAVVLFESGRIITLASRMVQRVEDTSARGHA